MLIVIYINEGTAVLSLIGGLLPQELTGRYRAACPFYMFQSNCREHPVWPFLFRAIIREKQVPISGCGASEKPWNTAGGPRHWLVQARLTSWHNSIFITARTAALIQSAHKKPMVTMSQVLLFHFALFLFLRLVLSCRCGELKCASWSKQNYLCNSWVHTAKTTERLKRLIRVPFFFFFFNILATWQVFQIPAMENSLYNLLSENRSCLTTTRGLTYQSGHWTRPKSVRKSGQ